MRSTRLFQNHLLFQRSAGAVFFLLTVVMLGLSACAPALTAGGPARAGAAPGEGNPHPVDRCDASRSSPSRGGVLSRSTRWPS